MDMRKRQFRYFMCDFETTVYQGQERTDVWASASVELGTEDVKIFHSIDEQYNYFVDLNCNIVAYYHNLKFDGAFWLSYLLTDKKYEQAYRKTGDGDLQIEWLKEKDMNDCTFKYSVSDKGMWYSIVIKTPKQKYIEIRDSLKLLPVSVKRMGESFGTKHKKLEMEYKGVRYPGCTITDDEKRYISNDVLVVKEALEIMFSEGHTSLTIGSCCMQEYKNVCRTSLKNELDFNEMFPDIYTIDSPVTKYPSAGEWVRRSYRGGWCYLVKGKENRIYRNGITADVNSLYPSVMHSVSGCRYPVGFPRFWTGDYIPEEALRDDRYYFVRVRTRFYLKQDKLPFIQIKSSFLYKGTECLESSDVYDKRTGEYYTHFRDKDGILRSTAVELTLTMTDYQLLKDHYNLVDFEILDGCLFYAKTGIFDEYIDKYAEIKMNSKGAKREIAKLFLNNLYGKMASSDDSSFKFAYVKEDGSIGFLPVAEHNKKPGYIPVGSAITSYARDFTIRAAQENYYGVDNPGFIYADTDSIHCDLPAEKLRNVPVDSKKFCHWKLESSWDIAVFTRQKTYIEHMTHENLEPVEPKYNIKCAGMPEKCKNLFEISLSGEQILTEELSGEEKEFLFDSNGNPIKRSLSDFKVGLSVPGKLRPKRIPGGILLVDTTYKMHE